MNLVTLAQAKRGQFKFTLSNSFDVDKVVALTAAFFLTMQVASAGVDPNIVSTVSYTSISEMNKYGLGVDAVLDDGDMLVNGEDKVSAISRSNIYTIRAFQNFLKTEAAIPIRSMVLESESASAFNQFMRYFVCSPLAPKQEMPEIDLAPFFDRFQNQATKIEIPGEKIGVVLGKYTVLTYTIPANSSVTFTLKLGAANA